MICPKTQADHESGEFPETRRPKKPKRQPGMRPEDLARSGSEFGEQSALFCWANLPETRERFPHFYREPEDGKAGVCKMYGVNNNAGSTGGEDTEERKKTNAIRGARAKQTGLTAGVTDIFIPIPRHGRHGLYIELKRDPSHPANAGKKFHASPKQKAFGRQVQGDGYGWIVCHGWAAAVAVIIAYLSD